MIKYPSTEQFRNVVKKVRDNCNFHSEQHPKIKFTGTVKLHGTNGGIGWDGEKLWCQSRNNVLDINNTNSGFYIYVMENKEYFKDILDKILKTGDAESVVVYGEWCGSNIQSGVALNKLEKMFVAFKIALVYGEDKHWINDFTSIFDNKGINLFNTGIFKNYELVVDFSKPEDSQNIISDMVNSVEEECPVGKYFGISGVGEGIVFTGQYKKQELVFKAKGQKHSVSKVKEIAKVDVEKLNSINEFVEYAVTENRVKQAIEETNAVDQKDTGKIMKWVMGDIAKEELDTLIENNLSMKDVQGRCANKVRNIFFNYIENN